VALKGLLAVGGQSAELAIKWILEHLTEEEINSIV